MPPRDPNKTARNKTILRYKEELRTILPQVLAETGHESEPSLNAHIGSKAGDFMDLLHEVIATPEEYIDHWVAGMVKHKEEYGKVKIEEELLDNSKPFFKKYVLLFLKRSFLNHYEELYKTRPDINQAEFWFGLNDAHFGLFVTPRFSNNKWENDKSEIRACSFLYWTIGHVMTTGLCYPTENRKYTFSSIDDCLHFFYQQARLTKSQYQVSLADKYIQYVKASPTPEEVPLLIPELRYDGSGRKHEHRLDFMIINPYTLEKVGFELSPWSTHGRISGKDKTLKVINEEAKGNFEKEMRKSKEYFKRFNIPIIHFTDSDLADMSKIFATVVNYLEPGSPPKQLDLHFTSKYFT